MEFPQLFFLYRKVQQHKGQTDPKRSFFLNNLAFFFSIYGDGGTISTRGVIINIKKYRWDKVLEKILCRKLIIKDDDLVYFE